MNRVTPLRVVADGRMTNSEYVLLHAWVYKVLGTPAECPECDNRHTTRLEWSNISGDYLKDTDDWRPLCKSCHSKIDRNILPNHCKDGHRLTAENTYTHPNGRLRQCRKCRASKRPEYIRKSIGG